MHLTDEQILEKGHATKSNENKAQSLETVDMTRATFS